MVRLPFDPIDEAARQWDRRWSVANRMHAVTSIMRAHQLLIARLDALLKPYDLTFSRYEVLVLLTFAREGQLPMGKVGERLQVHATSVSSLIQRLGASGFVTRVQHPDDRRTYLARITGSGRDIVEQATKTLTDDQFAIGALTDDQLDRISNDLKVLRRAAGDF